MRSVPINPFTRNSLFLVTLCLSAALFQPGGSARAGQAAAVRVGAEMLLEEHRELIAGKRLGLITNHSAVIGDRHLIDFLHRDPAVRITALFGPEHGIRGTADAGEAVADSVDSLTGAPVHSLYGPVRRPTPEMLAEVDLLLFDMQDVGARFYTYPATMGRAMISAAEAGIPFVVLDRPNPLGGLQMEGHIREERHRSGIGLYPTPITHGMTVGELARMIQGEGWHEGLETLELHVIPVQGWRREMLWRETGLPWIPPSPNIPDVETALVYPGTCLFEGTTASEGRGTFQPFLQVGAPGVDPDKVARELNDRNLPGLRFTAIRFQPESIPGMSREPKLLGKEVPGVKLAVTGERALQPVAAGIHLLDVFYRHLPEDRRADFFHPRGIRIRTGVETAHQRIEEGAEVEEIIRDWQPDTARFARQREPYLLYE